MADVLIVEDEGLQQLLLEQFLQPEHTVLNIVTDAHEAVAFAQKRQPDIVVLDLNLPDVNGLTAAKQIKARSPDTKIVVSTALTDEDTKDRAAEIPVDGYLIKPYSERELQDVIAHTLEDA